MKTLASCTPTEFVAQTVRIKESAEKWLELTDIIGIRKKTPENLPTVTDDMTTEEADETRKKRAEALRKRALKNASEIFDVCFRDHPAETLEILALCCFIEPEDIDKHRTADLLEAALELAEDPVVVRFFTLLVRLGA